MEISMVRKNQIKRSLIILVIVLLILAVILGSLVGFLLVTNYMNLGNLIQVVYYMQTQGIYHVSVSKMIAGAAAGMVSTLGDPYSVFMDQKDFSLLQNELNGSFSGLGILLEMKNGYITVVHTYSGTPAQGAGILANDVILKIGQKSVKGMSLDQASSLLRGPAGTTVTVIIAKGGPSGTQEVLSIKRADINLPTVEGKMIPKTNGIAYIEISQFSSNTAMEMGKTLDSLMQQNLKGIILDLRDNPGGEVTAAVEIARFFVPQGPIVYIQSTDGQETIYQKTNPPVKVPMVVLVNGNTASAAEILSGALKDTGTATLVGTKTFGKGIIQTVYPLAGGEGLKLTTARYLTPDKHYIQHKGIDPNVLVNQPSNTDQDVQFAKALSLLQQEINAK